MITLHWLELESCGGMDLIRYIELIQTNTYLATVTRLLARALPKVCTSNNTNILWLTPTSQLYISGGQDGAVSLWEWSHNTQVVTDRPGSIFTKVIRIVFTQQGNKFGVCDGDGNTAL